VSAPDVGFTDGQFSVTVPGAEPKVTPVPMADVLAALKSAGYTATYQAARETKNGIVGAGFEISTTLPAPPPGTPAGIGGETPVTLSIGFAAAEVASVVEQAAGPVTGGATTGAASTTPGTTPAVQGTGTDVATGLGAGLPTMSTPDGSVLAPSVAGPAFEAPGLTYGNPATAVLPGTTPTGALDLTALTASRAAIGSDVGWIYLMLVAVAGTAFVATFVLRYRGVRTR
jgi:hypothetical protein